jgi:hypothetical protein
MHVSALNSLGASLQDGVPHLQYVSLRDAAGTIILQCGCERLFTDNLCQSEISKLDVEIFVGEKDVLWLDIAVDNIALVLGLLA